MSLRQNALLLLLLTGLLAVASDWSGRPELERLWCLPVGVLLLGLAYEGYLMERSAVALQIIVPQRALLGRAMAVGFVLTQALRRSLEVELSPTAPAEVSIDRRVMTLWVPSGAAAMRSREATARRLGRYRWPPCQLRVRGVLGLAWWNRRLGNEAVLQVLPDVLHEADRVIGERALAGQAARRLGAGSEVLQLRDYRPGDPPRAIDWKASARQRRLISRDFSEDQHLEIVVAVDVGRSSGLAAGDTDRLALYANIAARLAQRAILLDDRVGLLLYADRPLIALPPGHGLAALMRVRASLGDARVQPGDSNPALAAARIRSLVRQRTLVVMLADLDDASATGELHAAARLLLPKHLPFIAGVASERAAELARTPAADEQQVYRALAAQEYGRTRARNVAALRALGAPALSAPAQELDRAVLDAYREFRQRRRV